ncbi:MAG TPA: hypothetical protein VLA39_04405 [Marinobacterium sp.]|nr:hypothetical protein [Marinobacterium sp.]
MSNYLGVAVVIAALGYLIGRVGKSSENPRVKRIEEVLYAIGLIAFLLAAVTQGQAAGPTVQPLQTYLDETRAGSESEFAVRVNHDSSLVVAELLLYWQSDEDARKRCESLIPVIEAAPGAELVENVWIISGMAQNEDRVYVCKGER